MVENKTKTLLFGGSGKLGREIAYAAKKEWEISAPGHTDCDITSETQLMQTVREFRPDLIINAAALVGTRECENQRELAWKTNTLGAVNISRICAGEGIRQVFISSALIFDGIKGRYKESDTPSPTYFYGITKVAAEQAVAATPDNAIVRLDFFPLTKLKYLKVFADHYTSKIPVTEAADKILRIAASAFVGIINIGQERKSLYQILKPYFPEIEPTTISQSALPDFPKDISLDLSSWYRSFGRGQSR